jgi:serine/arginine repetitive matrix protein 2
MQSSMPLSDRDPNTSGRTSRASHLSAGSKVVNRASHHTPQQYSSQHGPPLSRTKIADSTLSTAPGVLGMLRTTMEIGDVASLAVSNKRFGNSHVMSHPPHAFHPRVPNRRGGATSRLSTGSANSHNFDRSAQSRHRMWPSVSSAGRRRSITSSGTAPPFYDSATAPPSSSGSCSFVPMIDRPESPPVMLYGHQIGASGRSMSMTTTNSTTPGFALANYRSLSSLRSSGGPREPYPRPRSPFRYPTRLKRPGYRPSSPALSDVTGVPPSKYLHVAGSSKSRAPAAQNLAVRHPAPYLTHRNRSAPAVATMMNMPIPHRTIHMPLRDDTPSLSDGSMHRAKVSGHYKNLSKHSNRSNRSIALPSSDLPSSSNPPTPRDSNHVNPVILAAQSTTSITNHGLLAPLPGPVAYYDYSEDYDFEKEVTEVFNETMPDSPMPIGFLDRIRALLEERELAGNATTTILSPDSSGVPTPRDSAVFQDGVLVLSPGLAELPATPVSRRITREMIVAALAPSSDLLEPVSPMETVTDMVSTPPYNSSSLAAEPISDLPNAEDSDPDDYHSVASCVQSINERRSQAVLHAVEQLNNITSASFDPRRSQQSLASFIENDSDDNVIPPVPAIPARHDVSPARFDVAPLRLDAAQPRHDTAPPISDLPLRLPPVLPPPVVTAVNESVMDKVTRHWSLRRAAMGPTKAVIGGPKNSLDSLRSRGSTTIPEVEYPQQEETMKQPEPPDEIANKDVVEQ